MKVSGYPEASASSERAIRHAVDLRNWQLAGDTLAQAEAIARHYVSHALAAQQLLKMVEMAKGCKTCGCTAGIDQVIALVVGQIKSGHQHDLGLLLEWTALPNEKHAEKQSDGSPALQSELQVRVPPRDPIPLTEVEMPWLPND